MQTEKEDFQITFNALEQTKTKIVTNREISQEDKQLINDYLREKKMGVEESTLSHIALKWHVMAFSRL